MQDSIDMYNRVTQTEKYKSLNPMMAAVIPPVSQVSENVWRILGCNPSFYTLQGTNVYLVGKGEERIQIDAGPWGEDEFIQNFRKYVRTRKVIIKHLIVTHWHFDHIGALGELIPVFKEACGELPKVYKFEDSGMGIPDEYEAVPLKDGQILSIAGVTLKILHTPGHTRDHASVHFLEENVMFSGDTILGEGTSIYEDLSSYMKSLDKIKNCKPLKIFPAHGPINHDGKARIQYYITHHATREQKVYDCLFEVAPMPLTVSDITKKIYSGLSPSRQNEGRDGIQHHLKKLVRDGRVQEKRGKYFIDEGF